MEDYRENLGDYFGTTNVHPVALGLVVLMSILMLALPRRWAFVPMVVISCFVSVAQRVVVFDLDFDFPRILILVGFLRLAVRGEFRRFKLNGIDKCLLATVAITVFAYSVLYATSDALINRLGWMLDAYGFYFVLRWFFLDDAEPRRIAMVFAVASVPVAISFAIEFGTSQNVFSVFGGVPQMTWIRDGRLRCQGPFAHPLIAGCYWASVLPLIASMYWSKGRWRTWSIIGTLAVGTICAATNSSTSIMAVVFALASMAAFPLRKVMRGVRWCTAALLFVLHMCMKAPVWHLLARLTVLDASTGWWRFFVIDQTLRHFGEWWLIGTKDVYSWQVDDITNQYALVGIEGGVFALIAFLMMIWYAYSRVGAMCARLEADKAASRMAWALGCALFVHCQNFIAASYFGQCRMIWYLLLALIASQVPDAAARARPRLVPVVRRPGRARRAAPPTIVVSPRARPDAVPGKPDVA